MQKWRKKEEVLLNETKANYKTAYNMGQFLKENLETQAHKLISALFWQLK